MKFAGHFLLAWFMLMLTFSPVQAQSPPDTLTITLNSAQQIALEKNPRLQSAEKDIRKASAQAAQARGNLLPRLNAYTNYNHNFELPIFTIDFGGQKQSFRAGSKENITAGLQLQQPLFRGGSIYSGYQMARFGEQVSENQAKITRQQILLEVRQAYYNALFTKELIAVAEEALQNVQRNYEQVQKQKDVGTASGFDLLRAQVQVSNTRPQLIAAQHRHDQALTGLRTTIGLDRETPITVSGSLTQKRTNWADSSLAALQQLALDQRLEMVNVRLQRSMQKESLDIARAQYMPTLAMSANLQHQMQEDDLNLDNEDFIRSVSGGLSLSIPLFSGGSNYAGVQQAKVELRKVNDTEQQVRNMIAAEVESAYYSLVDAREKLDSQTQTIQQAEESLRLAELMYQEGTATQLDVLNAQLALQQARSNYSQYLLQYNVAADQLRKALNELNPPTF